MSEPQAEPTEELLRRIRAGNTAAEQVLYQRFLPLLQRWAHGRMPRHARDISDTDDLVQVTLLRALKHLGDFESSGAGSFLAYLRQILINEVRSELRKRVVRGIQIDPADIDLHDDSDSVIEQLVGRDRVRAYEAALATLGARQRELVLMRIEFGMEYAQIAAETGTKPDAVRVMLARALKRVAEHIAAASAAGEGTRSTSA